MNARRRRPLLVVLSALGLAVGAFAVWVLGIVGIGQYGEDICIYDAPPEAVAWQTDASVLPPRVTCVYNTREGETLEADHSLYAYAATSWLIGYPVAAIAGIAVVTLRLGPRARPQPPM